MSGGPVVLIVEDHEVLRGSLASSLQAEGFAPVAAKNLADAVEQMRAAPDLILLDWMLPDGQGIDFLKRIRHCGVRAPVIFLTARSETFDKVLGLELGASDYVTKPFDVRELVARIRARLRESGAVASDLNDVPGLISVGVLTIDLAKRKATFGGRALELAKKEFDLLTLLAEHPERVFSRDEILNKVWGYESFPTTRTVDAHVLLLRQKTDDRLIETVRSVGYKLAIVNPPSPRF